MQNEHSRKGGIYKRSIEVCNALLTLPQRRNSPSLTYSFAATKHTHTIRFQARYTRQPGLCRLLSILYAKIRLNMHPLTPLRPLRIHGPLP